jgi:FkbM family methyltransferase
LSTWSTLRFWFHERRRAKGKAQGEQGLMCLSVTCPAIGDVYIRKTGSDENTLSEVVLNGVYNEVIQAVSEANYVIDLGANIGLATLIFAERYKKCHIVALEPDERNFELLERNVEPLVREGRCRALQRAIWDESTTLSLAVPSGDERFDAVRIVPGGEGQQVSTITMGNLLADIAFPRVDILKVDIEGAEVQLFAGDLAWLNRIRAIAIEFHGDSREASRFDHVMQDRGFKVVSSQRHTVVALRRDPPTP